MANDNSFGAPTFGVVSNDSLLSQNMNDFFNSDEETVVPIKKEEAPKKETAKKEEAVELDGETVKSPTISAEDIEDDDETEEKTEDVEEEDDEKTDSNKEKSSVFQSLSEELFNMGLFNKDEGEEDVKINTPEEFLERYQHETEKNTRIAINNFLDKKGEDARQMFDAIYIDGVDPKEYLEASVGITDLASLDLENESHQEKVLREFYKDQGVKNIDTKIEKIKQFGELENEAKEAHEILLEKRQADLDKKVFESKQFELRKVQMKQDYVNNVGKILSEKLKAKEFDGIPVTPQFAGEIGDYITKEKWKTTGGKLLTDWDKDLLDLDNSKNYELKIKMAMLFKMLKEDPTLSKIQKAGVKKEASALFNKLSQQSIKSNTTKSSDPKKVSSF